MLVWNVTTPSAAIERVMSRCSSYDDVICIKPYILLNTATVQHGTTLFINLER